MTLDDAMQVLPVLVFAIVPSAARWHTWWSSSEMANGCTP